MASRSLSDRRVRGYERTFGPENVNFFPLFRVVGVDLARAERCILRHLREYLIHNPNNRGVSEWLEGIHPLWAVRIAIAALDAERPRIDCWMFKPF